MTTQQAKIIRNINDQIEADCWVADQAAREVAELDVRSVLIAIEVKLSEGNIEAARKIVADWKAGQL